MLVVRDNGLRSGPRKIPRAISSALVTFLFALATPTIAQQQDSQAEDPVPASDSINVVTQTAVSLGALTCAARIQQVTSFLGVTAETRASLRRPNSPADRNSLAITMSIPTDGTNGVALAEFYPTGTGCKARYSITVTLPQSCGEIRSSSFASLGDAGDFADNITMLSSPNGLRVILLGEGDVCTIIKTEILD